MEYDIEKIYSKAKINGKLNDSDVVPQKTKYSKVSKEKLTQREWAKKVVWYGHRNAAYFETEDRIFKDIAGHY